MIPLPRFLTPAEGNRLIYAVTQAQTTGVITQLVAACNGEGTSTLARDLALIAARVPDRRILLLDLDPPGDDQARQLCRQFPEATRQPMPGPANGMFMHRLGDTLLHVSEMRGEPPASAAAWTAMLPLLRSTFALVLIDSPALERSFDPIMLAPHVDTSILVVEAEATRAPVVQNLRDRIYEVGGRIAGTVLNKRRFHVPKAIYQRL